MKVSNIILRLLAGWLILLISINEMYAQDEKASVSRQELIHEIAKMDSMLFRAFNERDLVKFGTFFTKDLEFFHDKSGLTGYDHTMNFMKDVARNNNGLKRELVKESLEVYPIPGYGAMETGAHTFCHLENGKKDCGTFRFVHIWEKKDGSWKISRVISYGH